MTTGTEPTLLEERKCTCHMSDMSQCPLHPRVVVRPTETRAVRVKRARDGHYRYSKEIAGDKGNYKWPVSFDVTQTYIGINQKDEDGNISNRVLLTAAQYKALVAFVERGEGRK